MGVISEVDTPQSNMVRRSKFGKRCDFKRVVEESIENIFYNPIRRYCFSKFFKYFTNRDCTKKYFEFIGNGKRRTKIKTTSSNSTLSQRNRHCAWQLK